MSTTAARVSAAPVPVGRDAELAALVDLICDGGSTASAIVIEGEPGIGKTFLWRAAFARAGAPAGTIVAVQMSEQEAELPLVGLVDLLDAATRVVDPASEARAALDDLISLATSAHPVDPLVLGRGLLHLLRLLASSSPVVVGIDDIQWLDAASARALAFAIRRLSDRPIRLVVTSRSGDRESLPVDLGRVLGSDRIRRLVLVGLEPSSLDALLRARLGVRLPRPRLLELHRVSGGNPFFALEIVSAALRDGRQPDAEPLAVPPSLAHLIRADIAVLSEEGRRAVLLAALSGPIAADQLEVAANGREGIREAIRLGCLELVDGRVGVRHPLVGSVVHAHALPGERRDAHDRLAEVARDRVDRARHLAHATAEPDEDVSAELEAAAAAAAERGSPALGAELAEHAARLTPPGAARDARRRRLAAAEHRVAAGDPTTARTVLQGLVAELPPGRERAKVLLLLADTVGDDLATSISLAEQALAEVDDDPVLGAQIHTALGVFTWIAGDLARATEHTRASVALAEDSGDERLLAIAIAEVCHADVVLGRPWSDEAMERALAIERRLDGFPPWLRPSFQLGIILSYTDRPDEARPLILAELERVRASGDEAGRVGVLFRLAEVELRAGNWAAARRAAQDASQLAAQAGIEQEQTTAEMIEAVVAAHLGDLALARQSGTLALASAEAMGDRINAIRARGALGLAEVSAGRFEEALTWLEPAQADLRLLGIAEHSIAAVPENLLDALLAVGRLDEASEIAAELERLARPAQRAWHLAVAARGRALVAIARGDVDEAAAQLGRAYEAHRSLPNPFTLGRTHLAAGLVARRARRWADARHSLTAALDVFDRLGAVRWAERAGTDLGRLPGRAPAGGSLTATEAAVASLVAAGLSNKEIAARLSVAVRTVEQHASRVYQKLEVGSRAELAARLTTSDVRAPAARPPWRADG